MTLCNFDHVKHNKSSHLLNSYYELCTVLVLYTFYLNVRADILNTYIIFITLLILGAYLVRSCSKSFPCINLPNPYNFMRIDMLNPFYSSEN